VSDAKFVEVRVTRRFEASAERVFDAFLDPAKARRFLFTAPGGRIVTCDIDARVGGVLRMVDRRGDEDIEHIGKYLEIDRPRRLVFEFAVPKYDPTMTRVTIEIAPHGTGCELTLTHEVLLGWEEDVTKGWAAILDGLPAAIA
jgi:uncharacterized protein YndB with AHSA1/START domain